MHLHATLSAESISSGNAYRGKGASLTVKNQNIGITAYYVKSERDRRELQAEAVIIVIVIVTRTALSV